MKLPAIAALTGALLVSGCSGRDVTSPARHIDSRPSSASAFAGYDPTAPAPTILTADVVGTAKLSLEIVRITFTDTAEGESYVSAYFVGCFKTYVATQNIGGTPDASGTRVADVAVPKDCTTVRLRNRWPDVWGPFGNAVNVAR